jgi:hypothetical protein
VFRQLADGVLFAVMVQVLLGAGAIAIQNFIAGNVIIPGDGLYK